MGFCSILKLKVEMLEQPFDKRSKKLLVAPWLGVILAGEFEGKAIIPVDLWLMTPSKKEKGPRHGPHRNASSSAMVVVAPAPSPAPFSDTWVPSPAKPPFLKPTSFSSENENEKTAVFACLG